MRYIAISGAIAGLCALCGGALIFGLDLSGLARWAVEQQRALQNELAAAIRALQAGTPGALLALIGAAAGYGFVHAIGPGHGKYLIGGVGLGTTVPVPRLVGLAIASSLAQAFWAIVLVYGGFLILETTAQQLTTLAEAYLAPASLLAIAAIGIVLVSRGAMALLRGQATAPRPAKGPDHHHHHDHDIGRADHRDCGCHAHGPTAEEVLRTTSLRDAVTLVASIAIRPCTGAMFLLVIAWQMQFQLAGAAAVIAMGLGTALLTSLVAVSSVFARGAALASTGTLGVVTQMVPVLQILAGALIVWFSLVLLGA